MSIGAGIKALLMGALAGLGIVALILAAIHIESFRASNIARKTVDLMKAEGCR